jgi:hypothetical protein
MVNLSHYYIIMNSEMSNCKCFLKIKSYELLTNHPNDSIFSLTHTEIIRCMQGDYPENCVFEIVFELDPKHFRSTGLCRCPARRTVPACKQCQFGRSWRSMFEAEDIVRNIKSRANSDLPRMLDDIKRLFRAFGSFANFLSSSFLAIRLQSRCVGGQKKSLALSFDLKSIFRRLVRACEGNSLSEAWVKCDLGSDISDIFKYAKMPISSGSIFTDLANISIRNQLFALSMSMRMVFRMVPLRHLNKNHRNQTLIINCIAKYISGAFIRERQNLECK